jgi:hypothetical protein
LILDENLLREIPLDFAVSSESSVKLCGTSATPDNKLQRISLYTYVLGDCAGLLQLRGASENVFISPKKRFPNKFSNALTQSRTFRAQMTSTIPKSI